MKLFLKLSSQTIPRLDLRFTRFNRIFLRLYLTYKPFAYGIDTSMVRKLIIQNLERNLKNFNMGEDIPKKLWQPKPKNFEL